MIETDVDCMKYRKHTHLAGVDVEMIISEKKECILTIKLAYFDRNVDVSGNKKDGYFLRFEEPIMDMVCNSTNCKKIAMQVQKLKNCTPVESRNLKNWVGIKIKLLFDPTIKMMGKIVGGIVVDFNFQDLPQKTLAQAKESILKVANRAEFNKVYSEFKEFAQNPEFFELCKKIGAKYPKEVQPIIETKNE